jgi:RNA recognition motif-containing protein
VTLILQGFGFVEFRTEDDAEYAIKIMNMIKLYGQPLRLNKKATGDFRVHNKKLGSVGFIPLLNLI